MGERVHVEDHVIRAQTWGQGRVAEFLGVEYDDAIAEMLAMEHVLLGTRDREVRVKPDVVRAYARCKLKEPKNRARYAKYKITHEQAVKMLADQGGRCAVCFRVVSLFAAGAGRGVIDHNHRREGCPKAVRGILCGGCNTAEGMYRSSSLNHLSGARYLLKKLGRPMSLGERQAHLDLLEELRMLVLGAR